MSLFPKASFDLSVCPSMSLASPWLHSRRYPSRSGSCRIAFLKCSIETRSLPAFARSYPRRFTFYVAHPIRSIETRSLPNSLIATLATLPSTSLIPSPPFARWWDVRRSRSPAPMWSESNAITSAHVNGRSLNPMVNQRSANVASTAIKAMPTGTETADANG
jgi:hypothetical protein